MVRYAAAVTQGGRSMVISFAVLLLVVAVGASCALAAGTVYLLVRKTKRPMLWALTPVFALLWLLVGAVPLAAFFWASRSPPAPRPPLPTPIQVAPASEAADVPESP